MISNHTFKKQISKLSQLTDAVEKTGAQAPELRRGLRNLDAVVSEYPKVKDEESIHPKVAEEAAQMMTVFNRFLTNQSMACYHLAQRGNSDGFRSCQMRLSQTIRQWQSQNVNFTLMPEEVKPSAVKGLMEKVKSKLAAVKPKKKK